MKITRIMAAAAIAAIALFSSCKKEQKLGPAKVSVTPSEITFSSTVAASQDVELTATRDWHVDANSLPDWIGLSAYEGKASANAQIITVTVTANPDNDRSGEVEFSIGLARAVLTVKQHGEFGEITEGTGTLEDPYSVAAIIAYVSSLENNVESTQQFYAKGKISSIEQDFTASGTYGTARFKISDDGTAAAEFGAYNCKYLNNKKFASGDTDIKVGDRVVVCGNVVKYVGSKNIPTPQFAGNKCYIYELNGKKSTIGEESKAAPAGNGTRVDPYNVSAALDAVKNLSYTDVKNYETIPNIFVKGVISEIKEIDTGTYGNASYSIVDKNYTASFGIYRGYNLGGVKFTSNDEIKVGDEVVVFGPICNMFGNTPQFTQGSLIYKLNGNKATEPDFNTIQSKTVQDFITTASKTTYYKLKGAVSAFNASYCSFTLTDATGNIKVYTVNNKADWFDVVENGGMVEVAGVYELYSNDAGVKTHEMIGAYIIDFNKGESEPPAGDGSLASPFNVEGAIAHIKAGGDKETAEDVYVKGKISSIVYTFDKTNGTAQFNITNDGSSTSTPFLCYSVYFLENSPWLEGNTQIAVGDDVIIHGKLTCYNGTYETSARKAYIYSLNGNTKDTKSVFGVNPLKLNVEANATEAAFNVLGNASWTATCDNSAFTLSATSGEGAAEVKVTFSANADTENNRVANITVTTDADVATKSYTVVLTQAKAPKAGTTILSLTLTETIPGWPSGGNSGDISTANPSGMEAKFTSEGKEYTFYLGKGVGINTTGKYLWMPNPSYLGLPAVDGKKLVTVVATSSGGCSQSVKVGVFADNAGTTAVAGGENQTWATRNADYTYALTGTAAATQYYLCVSNKNGQIVKLVLTYE